MDEVLDSSYSLATIEEDKIFNEKKKIMYSVFDRIFKTDKGKSFVTQHKID